MFLLPSIEFLTQIGRADPADHDNMKPSKLFVCSASICVIVLTGVYLKDRSDRKSVDQANGDKIAALTRQINEEEWRLREDELLLRQAIRERRVLIGMTRSEVMMAKGQPSMRQSGDTLLDRAREMGGVELWIFDTDRSTAVLFGLGGQVIYATEVVGKPRLGNEIRGRR